MCYGTILSDRKPILCDGAINVRDNDFVIPVPQVDCALAAACALVLSGNAKCHIIWPLLQLQTGLGTQEKLYIKKASRGTIHYIHSEVFQ